MTAPAIPVGLLQFEAALWLDTVIAATTAASPHTAPPLMRARELWRRAQDRWATEHGLDRGAFEHAARQQLGALTYRKQQVGA